MKYTKIQNAARLLVAGTCLVTAGASQGAEFWLRSGTNTLTMPDGRVIPVWGFAQDSANWAVPGTVTVPGPQLNVAAGDTLIIHVTNTLPEPVSVVIPGQYGSTAAGQATPHDNPAYAGRMRSLTVEAASGKTQDFIWSNVQPGTFLYHSGSHPSVQVEMGLHGALAVLAPGPEVYAGVPFNSSATLVFGEIDPDLLDAVGAGTFGP
ncbi:MAG: multicopper oxidase domain-containing protein, partial [Verrucomicrobia bacterium]|nr:multicopper oxidase domain-containing protein [Verrucomicrobiota bacterium]